MSQIKIVTDSASDLSHEQASQFGIEIVPLAIRFGDDVFVDGLEITTAEFYKKMEASDELPQTSAPSPGDFEKAFLKQAEAGADEVLCIALSSKLSATIQSAELAAKNLESDLKVHIFDSLSVTAGELLYVLEAQKMAEAGESASNIIAELNHLQSEKLRCYGVINTLENLKKGGRIGGARALLGGALNIKPIVNIHTGEVETEGKVRTRKRAFEWVKNQLAELENPRAIALGHGGANDFEQLLDTVREVVDLDKVLLGEVGPVVGTHVGAGVIGLAYFL